MISFIKKIVGNIFKKDVTKQIWYRGSNVKISPDIIISGGKNIVIDDNVSIGKGAVLYATNAQIVIKKWFVAAHNLKIITGDHERRIGRFCLSITEAEKNHSLGLDADVVINEDVWAGMDVTILKGVTIGRGCTLCAGSVITKNTPPYAIVGGIPAKFIKFYWSVNEILKHESMLYSEEERFDRATLEKIFAEYQNE